AETVRRDALARRSGATAGNYGTTGHHGTAGDGTPQRRHGTQPARAALAAHTAQTGPRGQAPLDAVSGRKWTGTRVAADVLED
ncbi:hypothetical protein KC218_26390, partial [Mycobacterium tuberculosis]|nr:hypothetical protein [Mycobacterium tuberculosis]